MSTTFSRLLGRLGGVSLVAALLVATSGVAHASMSQVQDGFEFNPQSSWLVATGGSASAGFDVGAGTARSGRNNGWLFASNGWAFEGYWVPTNSVPRHAQCASQFYMQTAGGAQVGIEIWDANAHLLYSTYPWLNGSGAYQAVNTARWNLNGVNPVFVKAIVGASGSSRFVRIDDMTTQCYW
ncbi:hypothetical protein [Amycolatopsis sp.]|uniref:hypothetical protein n=1 Tax=Amycolatopsis sp. TaxID=37632 RepID=UPI002D80048E|nr:hypothetical protein [Amycolatopsis sp.]HET6706417.1 hypothetical protein [Amycolatopsis sp.]